MILVDVYVPIMKQTFDVIVDETAHISVVIAELSEIICQRANWPRPKKTTKADAKVHSSTFISCHPIAAERGIVRLYPVRPKKRNKKSGLAFTNPDFSGRGDRI